MSLYVFFFLFGITRYNVAFFYSGDYLLGLLSSDSLLFSYWWWTKAKFWIFKFQMCRNGIIMKYLVKTCYNTSLSFLVIFILYHNHLRSKIYDYINKYIYKRLLMVLLRGFGGKTPRCSDPCVERMARA